MKRLFLAVILVLFCMFCSSCNTRPPVHTIDSSESAVTSESVDLSMHSITEEDPIDSFQTNIAATTENSLETTTYATIHPNKVDIDDIVPHSGSIGYNLFYNPNFKTNREVILDAPVIMRDFYYGTIGFTERGDFDLFDIKVTLPGNWEKTARIVTYTPIECYAEPIQSDDFECFVGEFIYTYRTFNGSMLTMERILDELSENKHYASDFQDKTIQVEQGKLEDGRDYMFFKESSKNCVCYTCFVQLNEEYLYNFVIILRDNGVDLVFDIMNSIEVYQ